MLDSGLPIPELLLDLVERGVWPANWTQTRRLEAAYPTPDDDLEERTQRLKEYGPPLVPVDRVRLIHPTYNHLALYPPPFLTIRQRHHRTQQQDEDDREWNVRGPVDWDFWMPGQIDLDKAIEIADFGDGSEQPIILDYQVDPSEPNVRRLEWNRLRSEGPGGPTLTWANQWVEAAPSFDDFARLLGLA